MKLVNNYSVHKKNSFISTLNWIRKIVIYTLHRVQNRVKKSSCILKVLKTTILLHNIIICIYK